MSEKQPVYEVESYVLPPAQQHLVVTLAVERQQVVAAANRHLAEIDAAERELVDMVRRLAGLPEGAYTFEGDAREVRLKPHPQPSPPVERG